MNTHTIQPSPDAVLAAIFDPTVAAPDLPARTGLSLPELARWSKANAQLIADVREFLTQRAALIAPRLHLSSLGALDRVVRECPDLERVRKAATTILRGLTPAAVPRERAATNPTREREAPCIPACAPRREPHIGSPPSAIPTEPAAKLPLAQRLAANRLAALAQPPKSRAS